MQKDIKINFRLSKELDHLLEERSKELELPKGYVIRQALREYLGKDISEQTPQKISNPHKTEEAPKSVSKDVKPKKDIKPQQKKESLKKGVVLVSKGTAKKGERYFDDVTGLWRRK